MDRNSFSRHSAVIREWDYCNVAREHWPFLCGFLALPVIAVFIFAATLVTPDYSHVTNTISSLGAQGRPQPWIANTGIFLYGILVLAFAYGIASRMGDSVGGKTMCVLLTINGIAAMFAAIFQAAWGDAPVEPSLLGDRVHQVAARVGFMVLTTAMLLFPLFVWSSPQWRGVLWVLPMLAILSSVAGLLFIFKVFPDYSGVVQRTYFAMCGAWLQVVAVQMMRKPQQPQEEVSTSPAYESYA
jgi:hypothetical membrane protein